MTEGWRGDGAEAGRGDSSAGQRAAPLSSRARRGILSALLVALLGAPALAAAQSLEKRIDRRLDTPPLNRTLWGVTVVDPKGKRLYGRNEGRLFTPASNTKLVVTAVAAAMLPPDFRVRTSIYASTPVVNGVLTGDLILYGRGDPTLGRRCYATDSLAEGACDRDPFARLRALADTLRQGGLREVRGDLVGDGSWYEPATIHPQWEVFDLNWWYAAPVSGLGFNDNSVDFTWQPGPAVGAPGRITLWPEIGEVLFENRTVTVPAGIESDVGDRFFRAPGTARVWAEGQVALDHPPRTESFAVTDPNLYTARAMRAALLEAGISIAGTTRSTTDSLLYRQARATPPLAEVSSRPLRDWIFPILNTSQNFFAEMLLKQLGRRFGRAGSWQEGIAVERRFLIDSVGIDSTEFSLQDGSGLSSSNLVTPDAFARLLRFIRAHPGWPTFAAGLPQAGNVGSLRTRFVNTPLAGRVRAKTGSIAGVNTLSGYIERKDGKILTFSVQANHHALPNREILAAIDSVVVEMGK
ncbi:MAG TPA: D-alanyl-D-alanine carboxypeptidase/D-alanyl-D-alanine-endopeptidase [Gemmatimonadales bacterium]|nr:D-alanyl-D-alanine carboxypeptidase/D-alanyl-D-alanine-endopeptidase [Gemmatimonadales bacterium]